MFSCTNYFSFFFFFSIANQLDASYQIWYVLFIYFSFHSIDYQLKFIFFVMPCFLSPFHLSLLVPEPQPISAPKMDESKPFDPTSDKNSDENCKFCGNANPDGTFCVNCGEYLCRPSSKVVVNRFYPALPKSSTPTNAAPTGKDIYKNMSLLFCIYNLYVFALTLTKERPKKMSSLFN